MTTVLIEPVATATCRYCGKQRRTKPDKRGGVKLPLGWKREQESLVCRECWQQRYVLRALTFPVASPVNLATQPEQPGATGPTASQPGNPWKQLSAALAPLWAEVTQASNWMMTQLYVRDIRREGQDKMPPMPRAYLYPEARVLFPNLTPQTVSSIEQSVQRKYRARRYEIVWTHAVTLPSLRYPQPLPIHNQSWKYWFNEQSQPIVECRIGDSRWRLRLKSGARYRHQMSGLRRMADPGEMAIYKAHDGTLLVKLVGWLRRDQAQPKERATAALLVRTGSDHLLAALDAKQERLWVENCDHVARWIAAHRRQLQRWAEDQKAEQRPHVAFAARRKRAVDKYHHRLNSALQEIAAHVANFAQRRRYTVVRYSDRERWLPDFPYAALEARLKVKLDEKQIELVKEEEESDDQNPQSDAPPSGAGPA